MSLTCPIWSLPPLSLILSLQLLTGDLYSAAHELVGEWCSEPVWISRPNPRALHISFCLIFSLGPPVFFRMFIYIRLFLNSQPKVRVKLWTQSPIPFKRMRMIKIGGVYEQTSCSFHRGQMRWQMSVFHAKWSKWTSDWDPSQLCASMCSW